MRPIDETIEDIRRQAQLNRGKKITSCFLQDGDALVLKTDYLLRILDAINQNFPDMRTSLLMPALIVSLGKIRQS